MWTGLTNGSWTDGGLATCEPQGCAGLSLDSSVVSDCDGTLYGHTGTASCPSGCVASDVEDTVFQCLGPPGIPDESLPRWVLLVCTGQEFDDLEGIAHKVSVIIVAETDPCVWNDSTSLKIDNSLLTGSSECSLASVPQASASHDCDGLTLQEDCTAISAENYEPKSSATALTTQICHFDGYTYDNTGLQFHSCVTTTLLQCSDSSHLPDRKVRRA